MKKTITLLALFACTYANAQDKPAVIEIKKPGEVVQTPVEVIKTPVQVITDTTSVDVEISNLNAKLKMVAMQKLASQQLQGARLTEAKYNVSKKHYQISWIKGNFGGRIHFEEATPNVFTYVQNATEVAENQIPLIIPADVRVILKKIIPKAVTYQWLRRDFANGHKNYSTDFLIDGTDFHFSYNVFGKEKNITIKAKTNSLINFVEDEAFAKILGLATSTAVINSSDKVDAYIRAQNYDATRVLYVVHAQIAKNPKSKADDEKFGEINLNVTADIKGKGRLVFHYKQATPDTITETKAVE